MNRLFNLDSPIMRFLSRMADLIILNLITLVCCLPVITIGAAISAMYASVYKLQQEEGSLWKNYFHAFKINFVQATIQWLLLLVMAGLLVFALIYYSGLSISFSSVLQFICIFLLLLWLFCTSWVFPLQAKFHVTVKGNLKNAMICAFAFLPVTLGIAVLNAVPFVLFWLAPMVFFQVGYLWIFLWFALAGWLNTGLLKKPFSVIAAEETNPPTDNTGRK